MIVLLSGLIRRNLIELRRYAFDTGFQILGVYALFMMLFFGAKGLGSSAIQHNGTLPSMVIGFVVFTVVIFSYSNVANWTTQEATLGTLEQIAMSPFGLLRVLIAEYLAGLVAEIAIIGVLFALSELSTGEHLHIDLVTLLPLMTMLLVQLLGIGLIIGGLAMLFKRIVSLINLIQFGFLALIAAPVSRIPALTVAPVALANDLIRQNSVGGVGLLQLDHARLGLLAVVSAVYLALGVIAFRWLEGKARTRGVIGVH